MATRDRLQLTVQGALYKALKDDRQLSHATVVDILYATMSNGTVSTSELDDLEMIAAKSRTMTDRSKKMLKSFVNQARNNRTRGPFFLIQPEVAAAEYVCKFMKKSGRGPWPFMDRDDIGIGILIRFAYPSVMDQGNANLCGPAAFFYQLAQDQPGGYAQFAMHLYEKGSARLNGIDVSPSLWLRLAKHPGVDAVDWLTMGSLRDSENWFLTFDSTDDTLAGATTQSEMKSWFQRAGYSDVTEDANLVRHQRDTDNMDKASQLFESHYRVCLLIDDQLIDVNKQSKSGSAIGLDRHWIVLLSKIDRSGGDVKMLIYTWGQEKRRVPKSGNLPLSDFLENYYGYVAGKP